MTYLVLKELVHMAKDVIIVSASLSKDIAGKNENNKANAIRVLCQTLDDVLLSFFIILYNISFSLLFIYFILFFLIRIRNKK